MFRFRLQRILELREEHEKAKARLLASARDSADMAHQATEEMMAIRDQSKSQMAESTLDGPRVGHLHQLGFVLESLDARVILAADAAKLADEEVEKAQRLLEDAARDRRVLDRLKARHTETWRTDAAQKDRVQMDEIALAQFSRKSNVTAAEEAAIRTTPQDGSTS